jgi:hypothetical protein
VTHQFERRGEDRHRLIERTAGEKLQDRQIDQLRQERGFVGGERADLAADWSKIVDPQDCRIVLRAWPKSN